MIDVFKELNRIFDDAAPKVGRRRRVHGCAYCDSVTEAGAPMHDASERCESGKRNHCTCDFCF